MKGQSWQDRLHHEFESFDINHDGILSFEELTHAIRRLVPVSAEEVRNLLDDFDFNHDGKIDYAEFVDFVEGKPPPGLSTTKSLVPESPKSMSSTPTLLEGYHPPGISVSQIKEKKKVETSPPSPREKNVDEMLELISEREQELEMS